MSYFVEILSTTPIHGSRYFEYGIDSLPSLNRESTIQHLDNSGCCKTEDGKYKLYCIFAEGATHSKPIEDYLPDFANSENIKNLLSEWREWYGLNPQSADNIKFALENINDNCIILIF